MLQAGTASRRAKKGPITISVVVHVVYRTAAENISDAQIKSQIDALNRDYSAMNADKVNTPGVWAGLLQDSQIRFALTTKDPKVKDAVQLNVLSGSHTISAPITIGVVTTGSPPKLVLAARPSTRVTMMLVA
jgi:hypothetical protein